MKKAHLRVPAMVSTSAVVLAKLLTVLILLLALNAVATAG
jgi:hypothetical protein